MNRILNINLASYLITVAALRNIPIREYLLLELHPLIILKNNIILDKTRYQIIDILLIIAFFTLFERKMIAGFHIRKGPNKTSFLGILQPLLDALKLLTKQRYNPLFRNIFIFNAAPTLVLIISLTI